MQIAQRRPFALSLFYFHLICSVTAYSQKLLTSFGPVTDVALGYTPSGLALTTSSGLRNREIIVADGHNPCIRFYAAGKDGSISETRSFTLAKPGSLIVEDDLYGNGMKDLAILSADRTSISVLRRQRQTWVEEVLAVSTPVQRFLVADINNDKRKDILLFGRRSTGIRTVLGKPGGAFAPGQLLFPDISVSDARAADLNGDGITDLILLNWLSNQLEVYYGIGRGVFSEQISYSLPGEPDALAITQGARLRTLDIAVTLPEERSFVVLNRSAVGEMMPSRTFRCPSVPLGILYSFINADEFPDILTWTDQGAFVALGISPTDVGEPTTFGAAGSAAHCIVGDVDADRKNDLVSIDPESRRLIVLGNADGTVSSSWPAQYSVGIRPAGLATGDFNRDGRTDIAVANSGSRSISILINKGNGAIEGQQAIAVSGNPSSLRLARTFPGQSPTLIATDPRGNIFSFIQLEENLSRSLSFTVPTCTEPFALLATYDASTQRGQVFVRCIGPRDRSRSFSVFEQLGGNQFLERSVRLNLPYKIIALTAGDFLKSGYYDLLFATHNWTSGSTTISVAGALPGYSYKAARDVITFPNSTPGVLNILTGDIDGDGATDIIVTIGSPQDMLGIAYGRGDGSCRDSLHWIHEVHLVNEESLVLADVDGNGTTDITYVDAVNRSIMTLFGRAGGDVGPPVRICPAHGIEAIAIAGLRQPDVQDLVLSNRASGRVSIIFDPFRK